MPLRSVIGIVGHRQRFAFLVALTLSVFDVGPKLVAQTPSLLNLARSGSIGEVQSALRAGAAIDGSDAAGVTALHVAAAACRPEIVAILLSGGAAQDRQARDGSTALMFAARQGCQPAVEQLLRAGAKLEVLNQRGETASSIARDRGHSHLEDLLSSKDGLTEEARASVRGSCLSLVNYLDALARRPLAPAVEHKTRRIDEPSLTFGSEQPAAFLVDSTSVDLLFRQHTPEALARVLTACASMNTARWPSDSEVSTTEGTSLGFLDVVPKQRIYDDTRQEWVRGQSVLSLRFERSITR